MTPDEFRAALAALGTGPTAFARRLAELGHPAKDVQRSVRRWCAIGPPAEVPVILNLLRMAAANEGKTT